MTGLDEKELKKHTFRVALLLDKFVDQEKFTLVPTVSQEGKPWVKSLEEVGVKPSQWGQGFTMKSVVLWQRRSGKGWDPYNPEATRIVYRSDLNSGIKLDKFYRELLQWQHQLGYHGKVGNSKEIYIPARLLLKTKEFGGGGGSGGGASKTAKAEAGACIALAWLLKTGNELKTTDFASKAQSDKLIKDLDKFVDLGNDDTDKHMTDVLEFLLMDEQWFDTSVKTAKKLNDILQLSTKGPYTFHRGSKFMNSIYKTATGLISAGIKKMIKSPGATGELNDLSVSGDKWNPGDIWIANTDQGFKIREPKGVGDLPSLNTKVLEAFNATDILGISLKKIGKGAAANYETYNMVRSDDRFGGFKYTGISLVEPTQIMDSKDMYIEGTYEQAKPTGGTTKKNLTLQIRTFNVNANIQTELKGHAAAAGKAGFGVVDYTMKKLVPGEPLWTYPKINTWSVSKKEDAIIKYYDTLFTGKNVTKKNIQESLSKKKDDKGKLFSTWGKVQQDDYYTSKIEALQICSLVKKSSESNPTYANEMITIIMAYAMSLGIQDVFRASAYAKVS